MKPALLIVLDGFGIAPAHPFNAIENARMPFYQHLQKSYPHTSLLTHGPSVGLPEGIMGNSEIGHMTLGSGRVLDTDLSRISKSIATGAFFENPVLQKTLSQAPRVHLMGLLSDAGVHSHQDHLFALLKLCKKLQVPHSIHAFLDGRDCPPQSGLHYLQNLLNQLDESTQLASVSGRYWAMDRDQRWERTEKAYRSLFSQGPSSTLEGLLQKIQASYQKGQSDEFFEPTVIRPSAGIQPEDSVVFFNFRSDRARALTQAMTQARFSHFPSLGHPRTFAGMTVYDSNFQVPSIFPPIIISSTLGECLERQKLPQLRIAETEKYAHVTFFFNAGRELAFEQEDRILIPSPQKVPTYDLSPPMSARLLTQETLQKLKMKHYAFILMNFANADMVGHTGNYPAALEAIEVLDTCLSEILPVAHASGYEVLITADHGNAEQMQDHQGQPHTQHTLFPVPLLWAPPYLTQAKLDSGTLADVFPTLFEIMELPIPAEVTGKSLLRCFDA
jgi:2,3-bisphosphoglycerate-independent phosphoglycerate mutase